MITSYGGTASLFPMQTQPTRTSPGYYNCGGTLMDADMMTCMVASAMARNIDISDFLKIAQFIPDPHEVPYQTYGGLWR